MITDEELFHACLKQEIEVMKNPPRPFIPAWNMSEPLTTPEYKHLLTQLFTNSRIKTVCKTEEQTEFALRRAFDRYLINMSFSGKIRYEKGLAKKVYKRWRKEVESPDIELVVLGSMLNFEVNRTIEIGDISLIPIPKSGKTIELEKNIYKLLGFQGVKDIKRVDEFASYKFTYFMGGNAIKVKGRFPKRTEFFQYPSFPEPGHNELLQKIKNFATLLRIFKKGDFIVGSYHSSISSPFTPGEFQSGETKYTSGLQYPLVEKKEILRLRFFAKKYLPLIEKIETLPVGIQIGLEYLNSSYDKNKIHEKFIDIMIALDALLGTQAETSYRVSLRAACFLTMNKTERQEIYKNVKKALELRGKIVHGDVHPNLIDRGKIEQNKNYIDEIVRKIIVKLLALYSEHKVDNNYKETFEENYIL